MKFPWRSDKAAAAGRGYESECLVESRAMPGVKYRIRKISFERRMELMRRIRDLARRAEFLAASLDTSDKMDAALALAEIDRVYVLWGVESIQGLMVNGRDADAHLLAAEGPEELFRELLGAVRRATGLDGEERKN